MYEIIKHILQNKWQLLPHFLRLMKQHIASFDYFVETEIKKVVAAERSSAQLLFYE